MNVTENVDGQIFAQGTHRLRARDDLDKNCITPARSRTQVLRSLKNATEEASKKKESCEKLGREEIKPYILGMRKPTPCLLRNALIIAIYPPHPVTASSCRTTPNVGS